MLVSTRGIVLNQIKYGESSIIARIYTEQLGLVSFLIRGARSKKARIRSAHLQHLTLVDIELNHRVNKDLQHLKNLKIAFPYKDIPFNIRKSAIAVFLNEILNKVIREEEANPELFTFLFNAIQFLDLKPGSISLFHHFFLLILTKFLGFYPRDNYSEQLQVFDLESGEFTRSMGTATLFANPDISKALHLLLQGGLEEMDNISLSPTIRNELLEMLLDYYRLHIPGLAEVKSYQVLKEVFSDS